MKFGNQTHWDSGKETIDEWLKRERIASEKAENPTCPLCEYVHDHWWEYSGLNDFEVEDYEIRCNSCGKPFLVNRETQIRFECRPLKVEGEG